MTDEKDIYQPPKADLIREEIPSTFIDGSISANKFSTAGWLTVFYTLLLFPTIYVSFLSGTAEGEQYLVLSHFFSILTTVLWIYIALILKLLLNIRLTYHKADNVIYLSIIFSVIGVLLTFFMDSDAEGLDIGTILYFIFLVPYGIVNIILGIKLISIKINYRGLNLLGWMLIASGICMTSVILFLLAIPFGLVADIALIVMFFTAAKELKTTDRADN